MPGAKRFEKKGYAKPKHVRTTLKRLASYMGRYKALWIAVFILIAVNAGSSVVSSYAIKPALNDYIIPLIGKQNPDLIKFIKMLALVFAIFAAGSFASWGSSRIMLHISSDVLFRIRSDLFEKLETLPIKYYDTRTHGEIMSRFTNDIDTLRDVFSQSLVQLFSSVITVSGIFAMMIVLSPALTLIAVVSIAFIMLLAAFVGKKSAGAFRDQQKNIGRVNGYVEELIEGLRVVKVFNHEREAIASFASLNGELCASGTRANAYAGMLMPLMENLSHVQYALVAVAGALFVIGGKLDLGSIAAFLQYTRNFSRPITMMSQQFNGILNALAGAERVFAVIDEESEADEGKLCLVNACEARDKLGKTQLVQSFAYTGEWAWKDPSDTKLIRLRGDVAFDHVSFGYDEGKIVLHDICMRALPGRKIALVGSTGSGKTTVINLLTRFYDVAEDSGSITYDGIPINKIKKEDLRRSLGIVLQDTHLFSGTIRDNIAYGNLEASNVQIIAAARLANADAFIRRLEKGYDTVISGDGGNLSQGQRQLIAIARAAVADPPVLILDEATSSIDTRTEMLIQKGMDSLMKGRTVFVIAHRLSTVRNADEIVVLEQGTIIERGTHDELIASGGRYYRLYTGSAILE